MKYFHLCDLCALLAWLVSCYFPITVERKFVSLQEERLEEVRRSWEGPEGRDYLVCPELECPVCLVEMVPPTRIWQCRSVQS